MRFPLQSALISLKQTLLAWVLVLMSIPVLLISCGLVAVAAQLQSSQRSVVQKDFRIFDYYRGSQRPKALLHGREAEYLRTPIPIRRVTIETYLESGLTNLTATAETCYADRATRTAYSADPLKFQLGDGRFVLEGVGFHWNQTNSLLIISNHVKSVIRGDLMQLDIPRP